ncbi:helix-turn-helix domain-containing protein [Paenibacillus qinlingensis]|uniref:helix-turn-helix domain-containing protein n=1 Tax=Paenibacillus qinlingensis TaxID=1837343 RepID=UPI0015645074|nr:helix-turn-helix domain-containing protein [Paenibacillus qinlingensis]NQX58075.1 helix-turn-helix transcriptional regulator [Paenibacillus qinlingensis]
MKNLQPIIFIRNKSNSLFMRLIAGFLCIILLLASLIVYAVSVSKQNVRQEIVKYNTLMLENTKNNYEKHLDLVKKQMYLFFYSDEVQRLRSAPNYSRFPDVIREISSFTTNPYLFIDDIVFYAKQGDLVVEKGTSTNAELMFQVFYKSESYPLDFWRRQFTESFANRMLPAAPMTNHIFRDRPQPLGDMIPLLIKNSEDFYMIVFLDAAKMYKAFHQSLYNDLIIYNQDGEPLFKSTTHEAALAFDELKQAEGSDFIRDRKYHFTMKGEGTGYTYLYRVPVERIANQSQFSITVVAILAAAIVLSVIFSFLFAARINNPLKKVIESLRQMNEPTPLQSNIKEFNIISHEIHGSQMLRKQLSFMNHLKAIRGHEHDAHKLDFADKPFIFILFQIQPSFNSSSSNATMQQWAYYMKTYIDSTIQPSYPDSMTFQIEKDQILSLVFTDNKAQITDLLGAMMQVFDHDKEFGVITIAVTSVYTASTQLTSAFEEAEALLEERLLMNETQLIQERRSVPISIGLSPDQEKELETQLREGNTQQLVALLERLFAKWRSKALTASVMQGFADTLAGKIRNAIASYPIDTERLASLYGKVGERIQQCSTMEELEQLMLEWVTLSSEAVQDQKEEKYPITSFVMDYIQEHLSEEIYLDILAEKLKMSSGYLSSYFKAKTGKNIVDYINETRIAKATDLLADSRIKIHDAAKSVGYQNITSFNRMFKKYTGVTPSEYRKRTDS